MILKCEMSIYLSEEILLRILNIMRLLYARTKLLLYAAKLKNIKNKEIKAITTRKERHEKSAYVNDHNK